MTEPSYFNRPADIVAEELILATLVTLRDGKEERYVIKETEAYIGPHDLASHASKGRTQRTDVMFRSPGTIYMYLIYGIHEMFNIVTGEKGYPAAVLIRAVGTYDGPGKLTKALGITRKSNGAMLGKESGIWIEPRSRIPKRIERTQRIGVDYAKEWRDAPLRFVLLDE